MHGSPFLIVGVMVEKEQDSSYSGRDHSKLIIPSTTFRAITGQRYIDNFIYRATDPRLNKEVSTQITAVLGQRKTFDPADSEAVSIWDTTEMFVFFDNFMLAFKIFLGIMGGLTLVVGGIGVSNIMNVVVEERTREIGIKMALGAHSRSILAQFLLETMVLTAVGGAIGLAISWAICSTVPALGITKFVGNPVLSPELAPADRRRARARRVGRRLLPGPRGVAPRPRRRDEAVGRREMCVRSPVSISGLRAQNLDRQPPKCPTRGVQRALSPEIEETGT